MESFSSYKESTDTILDRLKAKDYLIGNSEINDVIDELYTLVDVNENYIDDAIMAIEKLCDNNPMFKAEWEGALDEVEDEVLEESKLGKLASIALLAISMGITLTGCEASPSMPPNGMDRGAPYSRQGDGEIDNQYIQTMETEETGVNKQKPTYKELIPYVEFRCKYSDGHYEDIPLTEKDRRETNYKVTVMGRRFSAPPPVVEWQSKVWKSSIDKTGSEPYPTAIEYKIGNDGEWTICFTVNPDNTMYCDYPWAEENI